MSTADAAREAAEARRQKVLARGAARLASITVGGPEGGMVPPAASALEPAAAAAASDAVRPPLAHSHTRPPSTARGAAGVLPDAPLVPPSPRGVGGGQATAMATSTAPPSTVSELAAASLAASAPARLAAAALLPFILPWLTATATAGVGGPLATIVAAVRPVTLVIATQLFLATTTAAALAHRPADAAAALDAATSASSGGGAAALRKVASVAALAGPGIASRLRSAAATVDAVAAVGEAVAVYVVAAAVEAWWVTRGVGEVRGGVPPVKQHGW